MLNQIHFDKVYLATGSTDLRKAIDGLSIIVQESFDLDPFSNSIFVFCNKKKDKIKIILQMARGSG
ncbi:MAG: IS66 family insertion sequence element accessory protein TnpB [Desulfobacteraceae bacterium]|nr:IS66 family insertion sequence element accessory protein TnpB [Desulfobacteraceae bacterium]MBC2719553.1 IS66 family insertion sequence element accessory protein TnpB [Desulfobacteraceae bacterium]